MTKDREAGGASRSSVDRAEDVQKIDGSLMGGESWSLYNTSLPTKLHRLLLTVENVYRRSYEGSTYQ